MKEKIMMAYMKGKMAVRNTIRNFVAEEKGVSDMVAIILLIVIIIAVAAIFREKLEEAVNQVFSKLTEFIK